MTLHPPEDRVLVLTPTGDDAQQARKVLQEEGIRADVVGDVRELIEYIQRGAAALLIAQEGFGDEDLRPLIDEIARQPSWSDLPILIVMSSTEAEEGAARFLKIFCEVGSLCFLERPLKMLTLLTAVRSALRARHRQYEVRDLLLQQKRLYEQAAQAIHIRDEFISIASHELKTPLTSLKLRFEIAAKDFYRSDSLGTPPTKLERLLTVGMYQIDRLNSLVDDLLDISKIQSGKMSMNLEMCDLAEVIRASLDRLQDHVAASEGRLEVATIEPAPGLWDAARLEQVLVNLVSNAVKYAPKGRIRVELLRRQERAILCVQDDGPGIPKEKQSRLFHQFERANASKNVGGLGLGLYIVHEIVKAHGGEVSVDSAFGHGSKFYVNVPIKQTKNLT